jgi:hypothetical protein
VELFPIKVSQYMIAAFFLAALVLAIIWVLIPIDGSYADATEHKAKYR